MNENRSRPGAVFKTCCSVFNEVTRDEDFKEVFQSKFLGVLWKTTPVLKCSRNSHKFSVKVERRL